MWQLSGACAQPKGHSGDVTSQGPSVAVLGARVLRYITEGVTEVHVSSADAGHRWLTCGSGPICQNRVMTDKTGDTDNAPVVGSRVQVTVRDSGTGRTVACSGVVIEDYAEMVIDSVAVGRDWAPVQRWAIALDDGRLVFADDEDLTTAE